MYLTISVGQKFRVSLAPCMTTIAMIVRAMDIQHSNEVYPLARWLENDDRIQFLSGYGLRLPSVSNYMDISMQQLTIWHHLPSRQVIAARESVSKKKVVAFYNFLSVVTSHHLCHNLSHQVQYIINRRDYIVSILSGMNNKVYKWSRKIIYHWSEKTSWTWD